MPIYQGHSTYNRARKFKLTDFELVKQDLFNHFHIRRGEKLMNPDFGTIIWDLIFEPYTTVIRDAVSKDIQKIVNYDPRVTAETIDITELANGILVEILLRYVPTDQSELLSLTFDRQTSRLVTGS